MTSFDTYDKPTLDTKFAGKVGSFAAVGGQTPEVKNGNVDLSILFSNMVSYTPTLTEQLLNNKVLQNSIEQVCAALGGGIKYDTTSKRYYFEV